MIMFTLAALTAGCSSSGTKSSAAVQLDRLSTGEPPDAEKLVDSLTELSAFTVGLHPTASVSQFLGEDADGKFAGGIIGSRRPIVNDAMRELVRMGPDAIHCLLEHLDDARPTRLEIREEGHITWARATNAYNNRPLGIDVAYKVVEESLDLPYVVKVGDVCLVILGQITDRPQVGVSYRHTGGVAICSPILFPEIVKAARDDWSGVTRKELFQHLRIDVLHDDIGAVEPALARIKAYFPERLPAVLADLKRRKK